MNLITDTKNYETKLLTMLSLQDTLNKKINPEWRTAGYAWHRAIMVEGIELLDHIGWKWWKKQEPDMAQARMELVDIWHFGMSNMLVSIANEQAIIDMLVRHEHQTLAGSTTLAKIDSLVEGAARGGFNIFAFQGLMVDLGMTLDELYTTYIAKNVLNTFRQDHGYMDGTYIKIWDGHEDNEVLADIMLARPSATPEELTERLGKLYALVAMTA